MTTTSPIDEAERARRIELVRDTKAALAQGESVDARTKRREAQADEWTKWFHYHMGVSGLADPVQVLPDAFARLEQIANDRITAAVKELKTAMREALK